MEDNLHWILAFCLLRFAASFDVVFVVVDVVILDIVIVITIIVAVYIETSYSYIEFSFGQ